MKEKKRVSDHGVVGEIDDSLRKKGRGERERVGYVRDWVGRGLFFAFWYF